MKGNINLKKIGYILQALLILAVPVLMHNSVYASFLTARSVAVRNPIAGAVTQYDIKFSITTAAPLGSIQIQFCENTPFYNTLCDVPAGFDISTAVLSGQSGETGFSLDPTTTANNAILTRTAAGSLSGPVEYNFTNVINPTTPNKSTYVRISTYQTEDATGADTDQGAAVFVTAGKFGTAAYVPPALYFCVGISVGSDCANTTGDSASFGDLLPTKVASLTTQFAAATNDPTGYVIYTLGSTLQSGNNTITPITNPIPSLAGFRQFGINLRANNNPNAGQDISGAGTAVVMPNYNTPNLYMFSPGAAIAQATQSTDYNKYTATYVANITLDQPVGVYATTITYVAVAQF